MEYPSKKWFISKNDKQLYAPIYNVLVDFCDQPVYSMTTSDMPGHDWVTDKGKLGLLRLPFTPRTWHIKKREWDGEAPPLLPPGCDDPEKSVWFMKDTLRNYSTGIFIVRSSDKCMEICEGDTAYVVQPMIWPLIPCCDRPDLADRKHHLRVYYMMASPRGSTEVNFYTFADGYFACTVLPFEYDNMSRDVQISRDRLFKLSEWNLWDEIRPKLYKLLAALSVAVKPKITPIPEKSGFMIMGLDVMVDPQKELWLFECNAGPVLREADQPMITAMMEIVCPEGVDPALQAARSENEKWVKMDTSLSEGTTTIDHEQDISQFSNSKAQWVRLEPDVDENTESAAEASIVGQP